MGKLSAALERHGCLMSDGAMGTSLFELGLQSGDAPELWNDEKPEAIRTVYREYTDAGSDIIITNSFGGNAYRLQLHGAADRVHELNLKSATLGREVIAASGREILLGGSMGPSGEILQPVGALSEADAEACFFAQACGLLEGGVDILWVETMSSLEEVAAAVRGCYRAAGVLSKDIDIVATLTFDTNGRTMMGVEPGRAVSFFRDFDISVSAFGLNCGLGPSETVASLLRMREVADEGMVLVCQSNCGIPQYRDGGFCFTGTPELMGRYARLAYACGARIIGGCCGSDGKVMGVIRGVLDEIRGRDFALPGIDEIVAELGEIAETSYGLHVDGGDVASGRKRHRRR